MTENPIRVQLPGGSLYASAMHEAASKTGARSGLPTKTGKALLEMVTAATELLNSADATSITLEMWVHEDSISVTLTGKASGSPTKRLVSALDKLATKKAHDFTTKASKSALSISFAV